MGRNETKWEAFTTWAELFEALCRSRGFIDNGDLAARMCTALGKTEQRSHEAMVRSIGNWRKGAHLPSRKNFQTLLAILAVDKVDPFLAARWRDLYGEARKADGRTRGVGRAAVRARLSRLTRAWAPSIAGSCAGILALGTLLYGLGVVPVGTPEAADVEYRHSVTLSVGESMPLHGARGTCGEAPPEWDVIAAELPDTTLGTWSAGGLGQRYSRRCGGPTPARGIVFTATQAGSATVELFGDPVVVTVR